jgi:glyceraldehyde 3-phosphate dehydrogenase
MAVKVAINGFGRIGRMAFKLALANKRVQVVAINDLTDSGTLAHLLQYDTVYGKFDKAVTASKGKIKIGFKSFPVFSEPNPANLPWKKLGVDVVLECTGVFRTGEQAKGHLTAGAKRVVISAPAKDDVTPTVVKGTESAGALIKSADRPVVSMASCTTNCISPVMQVLESKFGVSKALMTTIHSYTSTQNLVDGPKKDLRRARAAALNIIPTTTGAAIATTKVIPSLKNKFDGIAVRVPTVCGSLSDITVVLKKSATEKEINNEFIKMAKHPLYKGVLGVSAEPLVSSDYIGHSCSAVVDLEFTRVVGGNLVKVLAWYDNEYAYSKRLVEMAEVI